MLARHLNRSIVQCSQLKTDNQPFLDFLRNNTASLSAKRASQRVVNSQDVHVSRLAVSRDEATAFMTSRSIQNKNVLVCVDGSHLIGMKRLLSRQHLQKNVYHDHGEPVDILTKSNPSSFYDIDEIQFDQEVFLATDPLYLQSITTIASQQAIKDVMAAYSQDLQRGGSRLLGQYRVPTEYVRVVEAAHNLGNRIYFMGINEYSMRHILGTYLNLGETKVLFMETLKYCHEQLGQLDGRFSFIAKELLWRQHYSYLQPISHQLVRMFKRKVKGFYFGHPYLFNSTQQQPIDFDQLRDKQTDSKKIQKQAILSVLYGNIWSQPYTNNPFPYLAQNYLLLPKEDQKAVLDLFNNHYQRYSAARNNFFRLKKERQQS